MLEVVENAATTVTAVAVARPSAVVASLRDPSGTEVAQLTTSMHVVGGPTGYAEVTGVTAENVVTLDTAAGLEPGRVVWYEPPGGQGAAVRISDVTGTAVTLETAPAGGAAVGGKIYGLECTAQILSEHTARRGLNWRVEWTVTEQGGQQHRQQTMLHIVRMQFESPVDAGEAARYVSLSHPGQFARWRGNEGHYHELARRASARVRRLIMAKGHYPHLFGDAAAFKDAGTVALRIELAHEGLTPMNVDAATYLEDQERLLRRYVEEAIGSLQWHDDNDNGAVESVEIQRFGSIVMVRR